MGIIDTALAAARAEISVIPILADGSKKPAGRWKRAMTERADELALRAVLGAAEGYGVVCGEVSGRLLALDFEGRFMDRGGMTELLERFDKAGLGELYGQISEGYTVWTPSGGMHILIRLIDGSPMPPNEKLAFDAAGLVTIETRGEGGFVVGAGSNGHTHANGGCWTLEEGGYETIAYVTPGEWEAIRFVLCSFDERPAQPPRLGAPLTLGVTGPTPSGGSMIERSKPHWPSMATILESHGWTFVRSERSGELWRHPWATNEHSARINSNGRLYAWSGLPQTSDASGNRTWDVPEVDLMLRLGREPSSAEIGHWCAQLLPSGPTADQPGGAHTSSPPESPQEHSSVIDSAFWESPLIPWAAQLYETALAHGRSPDGVLGAFLAMYATIIPVGLEVVYQDDPSQLNPYHVIVGRSGAGKSAAVDLAARLLGPSLVAARNVRMRVGLRSGQGLSNVVTIAPPKPPDEGSYYDGVMIEFDEAGQLAAMANNKGDATIDYLDSAWSGRAIGGAKAGELAIVPARRVRYTMVMGCQPGAAWSLFDPKGDLALRGFPQRLDFFSASHPAIPPGRPKAVHAMPLTLREWREGGRITVDDEIADEVWAWQSDVREERIDVGLDGHMMQKRLRITSILLASVGEKRVHQGFWSLGKLIENHSRAVRTSLLARPGTLTPQEKARFEGELAFLRETATETAREATARQQIVKVLNENGPMARNKLLRAAFNSRLRPIGEDVLDQMEARGLIHREGPGGDQLALGGPA